MAATLTLTKCNIKVDIDGILTYAINNANPGSTLRDIADITINTQFTNGTGANQAKNWYTAQRTVTGSAETLDLAGSLYNGLSETVITATAIKALLIYNRTTTVGYTLTVGAAAAPIAIFADATDKLIINPGGLFLLVDPSAAGYAVGAGSTDGIKIDPGANTITYDIFVLVEV